MGREAAEHPSDEQHDEQGGSHTQPYALALGGAPRRVGEQRRAGVDDLTGRTGTLRRERRGLHRFHSLSAALLGEGGTLQLGAHQEVTLAILERGEERSVRQETRVGTW